MSEPTEFTVAGRPVKCPHCGHTSFASGHALLNKRGTTLLKLDWTDPGATILTCAECGRVEWFVGTPDPASDAV